MFAVVSARLLNFIILLVFLMFTMKAIFIDIYTKQTPKNGNGRNRKHVLNMFSMQLHNIMLDLSGS